MNVAGLTFVLIVFGLAVTMIFTNHKIRVVTNNYWFWLAIAAVCFIGVFANRFVGDGTRYGQEHATVYANPGEYGNSKTISRAFMLDACPFLFATLCISLIADPSRRVARMLAPLALVGGTITIAAAIGNSAIVDINARFTGEYVFLGIGREKCYFIMHSMQILLAAGVMLNTPKTGWRIWVSSIGIFGVYLAYVGIVMAATGCAGFTTGLSPNDYVNVGEQIGEYHIIKDITGAPNHLCPLILIPTLALFGAIYGIVFKNYVFSRGIGKFGNAKSGNWQKFGDYKKFVKEKGSGG